MEQFNENERFISANKITPIMATQQKFVDFIIEQIDIPEQISYKKMFGEYGLYFGDKMFALVCDNKLFIKPTLSGREYLIDVVEESPYSGVKPCFFCDCIKKCKVLLTFAYLI